MRERLIFMLLCLFLGSTIESHSQVGPYFDSSKFKDKKLLKLAGQGDAEAAFELGGRYRNGSSDVPPNEGQSTVWFHKAAESGFSDGKREYNQALNYLYPHSSDYAVLNRMSNDQEPNAAEALFWLLRAADHGNQDSLSSIGMIYADDDDQRNGVKKDSVEAVKWFTKAAEHGDTGSQFQVGKAYLTGTGVAKDKAQADRWLRMAGDQKWEGGVADAYLKDGQTQQGLAWLRKGAARGDEYSLKRLADVYGEGKIVEVDPELAKSYKEASDQTAALRTAAAAEKNQENTDREARQQQAAAEDAQRRAASRQATRCDRWGGITDISAGFIKPDSTGIRSADSKDQSNRCADAAAKCTTSA